MSPFRITNRSKFNAQMSLYFVCLHHWNRICYPLKAHNIIICANQIPLLASTFPPFSSRITISHDVSTIFSSSTHHFPPQKYHFSRRNSAVSGTRTGWCCTATVTRSWSAASMRPAPAARGEVPGGCWPSPSTMDGGNFLKMVRYPLVN